MRPPGPTGRAALRTRRSSLPPGWKMTAWSCPGRRRLRRMSRFHGIRAASPGRRGPGVYPRKIMPRRRSISSGAGLRQARPGSAEARLALARTLSKQEDTDEASEPVSSSAQRSGGGEGRTGSRLPVLRRGAPSGCRTRPGCRPELPGQSNKRRSGGSRCPNSI